MLGRLQGFIRRHLNWTPDNRHPTPPHDAHSCATGLLFCVTAVGVGLAAVEWTAGVCGGFGLWAYKSCRGTGDAELFRSKNPLDILNNIRQWL